MAKGFKKSYLRHVNKYGLRGNSINSRRNKLSGISMIRKDGVAVCVKCGDRCHNIIDFMQHSYKCIIHIYRCINCKKNFDDHDILTVHMRYCYK